MPLLRRSLLLLRRPGTRYRNLDSRKLLDPRQQTSPPNFNGALVRRRLLDAHRFVVRRIHRQEPGLAEIHVRSSSSRGGGRRHGGGAGARRGEGEGAVVVVVAGIVVVVDGGGLREDGVGRDVAVVLAARMNGRGEGSRGVGAWPRCGRRTRSRPHAGGRGEQRVAIGGRLGGVGPQTGAVVTRDARPGVADAGDAPVAAPRLVLDDHGRRAGRVVGVGLEPALAAEAVHFVQVAPGAGFAAEPAAVFPRAIFAAPLEPDLVERFHLVLAPGFLFVHGLRELDDRVDAAALAFAPEDLLVRPHARGVGGEGHDAADGGVAADVRAGYAGSL